MRSTMGRGLAAGTAVVLFVVALFAVLANADRLSAAAALAGLTALSLAMLLSLTEPPTR